MVSFSILQDESQSLQSNDNTEGKDQFYGGNHDIPQFSSLSIIQY